MVPAVGVRPEDSEVGVADLPVVGKPHTEPAPGFRSSMRAQPEIDGGSDVVHVPVQPQDGVRVQGSAVAISAGSWKDWILC